MAPTGGETIESPTSPPAVQGWRYRDAPAELRSLVPTAEPDDWVFVLAPELRGKWFWWLDEPQQCGMCDVRRFDLPDGREVGFMLA